MNKTQIKDILKEKILILDGAMGTAIQAYHLSEEDYKGSIESRIPQKGNNDLLNLTQKQIISDIHTSYA